MYNVGDFSMYQVCCNLTTALHCTHIRANKAAFCNALCVRFTLQLQVKSQNIIFLSPCLPATVSLFICLLHLLLKTRSDSLHILLLGTQVLSDHTVLIYNEVLSYF